MRFLSVCSGIEAASVAWAPLGWRAHAFSEIEPFPCAVLAHHYPDTPNWGDMTKFEDWPDAAIDLLVGGTPCQDLSIAGKRSGLAGERSGLFFDFVRIAERYKPTYIVWENVPGALSTNDGDDIRAVIDAFTEIGYACDIDILDAQCFGLAQRRRRIFIVCVRLDDLLTRKTPLSARIAGELLLQPLRDTWAAILQALYPGKLPLDYESPIGGFANSARRKTELLEKALEGSACTILLRALAGSQVPSTGGQKHSDSISMPRSGQHAVGSKMDMPGFPSWTAGGDIGVPSTGTLWRRVLDALCEVRKPSTTSTSIHSITPTEICTFAAQTLNIARYITNLSESSRSPQWSADYWNLASLLLTTLEAVTVYARHTTEDLFSDASLRDDWRNNIDEARELARQSHRNLGQRPSGDTLFSLPDSLSGNPAPRREPGKGFAADIAPSLVSSGRGVARTGETRGQDPVVACFGGNNTSCPIDVATAQTAQTAHGGTGRLDFESETFVAHALRGEGFDASEDGTGRGKPLVPVCFSAKDHGADAMEDLSPTLRAGGHSESHANGGVMPAIAYRTTGNDGCCETGDVAPCLNTGTDPTHTTLLQTWRVRRLMPTECEALMGFPRRYTAIPYRGKPAADGPRYKALGNSFAVNVVRWIGQRIALVDEIGGTA